jgi:hypothetical protein
MNLDMSSFAATSAPTVHIEEAPGHADIVVQTRTTPHGILLHALLEAVQKEVPGVSGLHVRGDALMVSHAKPPSAEDRERIARVLSDTARLDAARSAVTNVEDDASVLATLKNPATPDAEWLRTFRQYAVKVLLADKT